MQKRFRSNRPSIKPIESRFNRIQREMSHIRPNTDVELEKDIAYLVKEIQDRGFEFFPNHYIFDAVAELEQKVKSLKKIRFNKAA